MSWVGIISAVLPLIESAISSQGSKKAANTQANAGSAAANAALSMFNQTRESLYPWMQTGKTDLLKLNELAGFMPDGSYNPNAPLVKPFGLEDFQASPAFNFNLEQGKLAIDKASAARGKFYAPSTLQDIARYSQGLASNEFQNAFSNYNTAQKSIWDRLYSLQAQGQNAAANTGAFGANASNQIGNALMQAGNAQAAGIVGQSNALNSGLSGMMNAFTTNGSMGGNYGIPVS